MDRLKTKISSICLGLCISGLLFITVSSCEIGLGSAVDTEVPEITVEKPAAGAVIRNNFLMSGNWSDDGSIKTVSLILKDTENNTEFGSYDADFETLENESGKGIWKVIVDVGTEQIPDGTYEAIITITDDVDHSSETQRQIIIDNTAPVLVMQRPSSKTNATDKIESYGQIFSLDGQAADDNGIGLLEVKVYQDPGLQDLLKTISFTNVPNTISLDVAKFIEGENNDYSAIYGNTYIAGEKTLYCKIIAYDGAQCYPTDGSEQTAEDLKGNPTTEYYLYNDISEEILSEHKITELYSMKAGRYVKNQGSRTATDATLSSLNSHKIEGNVFTLNPKNNPTFTIAGFSEMAATGNFEAENMTVSSGDFLTIQVEPGLDGHLLVKDSLRVKVKEIGNDNAPYIYPSEQTISKDGDKYRIIAFMKKEDGLVSTKSYTLEVEGRDEERNAVTTPRGIGYGFYFRRSTVVPTLTVTNPDKEDEITLNETNNGLTITGNVNFPGDVCNGGKIIIKTGTGANEIRWIARDYTNNNASIYTDQTLSWSYDIELKKGRTETEDSNGKKYLPDGQYQLEIFTEYYELGDVTNTLKETTKILRNYNVDTKKPNTPVLSTVNNQAFNQSSNTWYTSQNMSIGFTPVDPQRDGYSTNVNKTEYAIVTSLTALPGVNDWEQLSEPASGFLNGLSEGRNYLYFRYTDTAGNVSELSSAPTAILVDTFIPAVTDVWVGDGNNADGWLKLSTEKSMTISGSHGRRIKLEIEENNQLDASTPVTVYVKVGDVETQISAADLINEGNGKWSWISNDAVSNVTNSTIEIIAKAKDEAGGESVEKKVKYLIDTAAPVIQITQPGESNSIQYISSEETTLRAAISDENGTVKLSKYKLTTSPIGETAAIKNEAEAANAAANGWITATDKGSVSYELSVLSRETVAQQNISIPENVTNGTITEGHWYFYVYSIDDAGNADAKKREFWTDLNDPSFEVIVPPQTTYNQNTLGTNGSGNLNSSALITVSGTARDANGITSVVYSTDGGNSWVSDNQGNPISVYNSTTEAWEFTVSYGESGTLADGTYTFVVKATDNAGKTTLSDRFPVRIDCESPTINSSTITNTANNGWYKTKTIVPRVTVTDNTSASGNITVEYSLSENFTNSNPLTNNGSGVCIGSVPFGTDGSNKVIYVKATDEAGNSSTSSITGINIDTAAPLVQEKYYQISSQTIQNNLDNTVYVNSSDTLTIWGNYSDAGSGVEEIQKITIYGIAIYPDTDSDTTNDVTIKYSTTELPSTIAGFTETYANTFDDYADSNATSIKAWKAVIPSSKLQSGNISANGKDRAGNPGYAQQPTINIVKDTVEPEVSNVSVTDDSNSGTRVYQEGETTVYYLDNSKISDSQGRKFIISGISSDNVQVQTTTLSISDGTETRTYNLKSGYTPMNWAFEVDNLDVFTNSATATIEAIDFAGNKSTLGNTGIKTLTLNFDSTAPAFKHRIDANKKDVNFRIGEYENDAHETDVGGKYQPGTWGTTPTLIIRGTVAETGSGLSKIYYKLVDSASVTSFNKNDDDVGTIDPSELTSENATRNVNYTYYTNENNQLVEHKPAVSITSSFKGEIRGLSEGENYLLLMAEDNVGHLAPDTMIAEIVDSDNITLTSTEITNWNNGASSYKLNVDTHAPSLTSTTTGTKFTNGKTVANGGQNITVTGTCSDTGSGIKSVTVSVKIGTGENETISVPATVNNAAGTWTATIPASDLTALENTTNYTEGKTFNIDATAKDVAGLSTSATVAILQIDRQAPGASLISMTPAVERSGNYYIRPTQDDVVVKGNTDDTYSTEVKTYLKIVPYTITGTGDTATETEVAAGVKYISTADPTDVLTAVTPSTARTWTLTIPKETFTLSYSGANIYACTKDLAGNEGTVSLTKLIFDETGPAAVDPDDIAIGGGGDENTWHRNTSLSLSESWKDENGAGVDKVYYTLVHSDATEPVFNNTWTAFTGSENDLGVYGFENTIEGFNNGTQNFVYMYAVDKLGNAVTSLHKITVKVDTQAPVATDGYEADGETYNFTNIYLTNGTTAKTLYYYIEDSHSGIKVTEGNGSVPVAAVKLGGSTVAADNYSIALSPVPGSTTKKLVTLTLNASVLNGNGHRAVVVTLQDNAGNYADTTIGTINMDTTPPVVRLDALKDADSETNGTQVNGIITITGTATDTYLKTRPLTAIQYSADNGATWSDLYTDFTETNTNITNDSDFSVKIDTRDTEKFTDKQTYKIKVQVTDEAGNSVWSTPIEFKVDQDTDRPVIKFTNLELPVTNGTTETKADITLSTVTLKGTVVDDDELYATDGFQISLDGETHSITPNSGAWSYTFTADGTYEVEFIVKDGAGTTFTAGEATSATELQTTPKLTDGTNWLGTHADGSHTEFSLMVDTKLPVTQNIEFKLSEDSTATWSSALPKLGGPSTRVLNNKFLVRLVAGDENEISSVEGKLDDTVLIAATTQDTSYTTETIQGRPVKRKTYQFSTIDVSYLTGGSHSLELTITDGAGNEKKETITLSIDRDAPELTIVTPTENTLESASIWANGTISGARDHGLKFAISTTGQTNPTDTLNVEDEITSWEEYNDSTNTSTTRTLTNSTYVPEYSSDMNFGITWNIYFDNDTSSTADTHDKLLNQYLIDMGITTQAALSATDNTQFSKLVKLYLWMKAEDEVGNVIEKAFPIILDPQGDRPTLNFTYPDEAGKMLGGKVTIYGTVEDTLGDHPGVDTVWVQPVSSIHWKEDPSNTTSLIVDTSTGWGSFTANASNEITAFTLTTKDLDYLASNGYHVYNMKTYKGDGTDVAWTAGSSTVASGYSVTDYAVKATVSGTAWLLDINGNKEFNPSGTDPSSVALRVYARDNDGKFSIKFDRLVKFDANKPVISNLKLVQYDNETSYNITASQTYGNNVFVKGVWWLTGTVTDGDKIGSLSINGTPLVQTNEDTGVITPVSGKAWWATGHSTAQDVVEFRFKLLTGTADTVGEQSVNIIAHDAAAGTPNEQNETITVKYDNKAPVIAEDADHGRDISTTVQQYNGFYKFGSSAKEEDVAGKKQSGFAYTAFYFKRAYSTTIKLYDVLQARSDAEHDISTLSPVVLGTEGTGAADNTLVTKDGLYWFVKTVTTNDTMSITMNDTSNVHKNSLVLIDGTYYLVDSVGSNTVTFTRNIPAGKTKAYVALAGIVNNSNEGHTDGAKPQWPGNGYYAPSALNRDDGDLMIEDVSKLDTTWTWEANICSRNIPDGPVDIVYVVYDNAGNSVSDSVSGFVCNNQPRIAGVTVKTDYTGNNVAEYVVTDYSASELSEDSVTGSIGTSPNIKKVYDPFANSLTKNDEYPLSQAKTGQNSFGTAASPVLKVRGRTQIIPEIVGGNGSVHYSYDVTNTTKTLDDGTHPRLNGTNATTALYSETAGTLNYDYTINESAPIDLQLGDLVYLGDTTTGIPFKFTFKDETEGLSTYSAAEKTAWETQLGVKFEAELEVYLAINACQETWPTASIKPFYWDSLTENSIYDSENATSYKNLKGHIELEKDWTKKKTESPVTYYSAYDGNASGTYLDADPKVSGEIVIKGTAFDAKLLKKIQIIINGVTKDVALYNSETGELESQFLSTNYGTNGIWFNIDEQTLDSNGHSVEWTLNWDTQNTSFVLTAKKDVEVKVIATNGGVPKRVVNASTGTLISVDGTTKYVADQVENVHSNTIGDTPVQTGSTTDAQGNVINTAFYRMDVVPYVTDVQTSLSSANSGNPSVYSRTALGHYPVYMTHVKGNGAYTREANIKVYGFNLKGGKLSFDSGDNGSNSVNLTAATGYYTIQIPTGARSGKATVTVGTGTNAVESLNNRNYDDSNGSSDQTVSDDNLTGDADIYGTYFYNRQPNDENNNRLTDDLYFDVWDFNSQAAVSQDNSCLDIMMKINPSNGLIGFAFCDGTLHWSMAGKADDGKALSYRSWAEARDFIQLTGFGYDSYGNSYGTAAGGESSGEDKADSYCFYTSRWGKSGITASASNHSRIECTAQKSNSNNENVFTLDKKRFHNPTFAAHTDSSTTHNTDLYLAYYDAVNGEIRFRAGTINDSTGVRAQFGSFIDRYSDNNQDGTRPKDYSYNTDDFQILANGAGANLGTAGEFLSLGVTSDNVVVIIWYDGTELKLAYNTTPLTLATGTNKGGWEDAETISSGASKYCQLVVDGADNIHVAAYDNANGDLKYIYIPKKTENGKNVPDVANRKECIVDSYLSVGKELTIDVAAEIVDETVKYIPHIGYFGTTPKLPRYAYLADPIAFFAASNADGRSGTNEDMYTGIWECGVVPTNSTITLDEKRRINVGVWKKDITPEGFNTVVKGMRVASNYTGFLTGTSTAASKSGTCYGNTTPNAVLAYGVQYSKMRDFVETAQMR